MGFSRQEYWSGLPFPSPGDLPKPGTEPGSPTWAGRWILCHWATRKASRKCQEDINLNIKLNPHWRKSNRSLPPLGESGRSTQGFLLPARTCRRLTYTGGQWLVPHSAVSTQAGQSTPTVHGIARVTAIQDDRVGEVAFVPDPVAVVRCPRVLTLHQVKTCEQGGEGWVDGSHCGIRTGIHTPRKQTGLLNVPRSVERKRRLNLKTHVGVDWIYLLTAGLFLGVWPLYLFLSIDILMTEAQ